MSTMERHDAPSTRWPFTEEFKADPAAMVLDEDPKIIAVAQLLGGGRSELAQVGRGIA